MQPHLTAKQFITSLKYQSYDPADIEHLLESNRPHLVQIFQAILVHPRYKPVAKSLLYKIITNVYKMVNQKLQLFIISNVWKRDILQLFQTNVTKIEYGQKKTQNNDIYVMVYIFLCQKMRSLKFITRITALKSFEALLKSILHTLSPTTHNLTQTDLTTEQANAFDSFLAFAIKKMLKKQQLAKTVSYNQGLFLQLLEDEFHEIRVTTLAVLELVTLSTPYFYSIQQHKGQSSQTQLQTLSSLKQTILYMLNDEHELVRERSLVAIFRISCAKNHVNNLQVFNPLSSEDISTIMMCLRQNNTILRQKVYECLKVITLSNITDLLTILFHLNQTLLTYKQDKTKIYWLLKAYSQSQKKLMLDFIVENPKKNIKRFYNYSAQEPNCKSLIYKGKVILLREVILEFLKPSSSSLNPDQYHNLLPGYIVRHLSFVEDTQSKLKLCETQNTEDEAQEEMQAQQEMDQAFEPVTQPEQKRFTQQTVDQQVQCLNRIKSILDYETNLTQQHSFHKKFLSIIYQTVSLIQGRLANQGQPLELQQNARTHPIHLKHQMLPVSQEEIDKLLDAKNIDKSRQILQSESVHDKISNILFEIHSLSYLFSLDSLQNQSLHNFYFINLIISLIQSIKGVLETFPQASHSIDQFFSQIEAYFKAPNKNTQFKQKKFRIRPITLGRTSVGTGYSDKLLIMVEHPTKILQSLHDNYQNQNIWIQIHTVRTQFDPTNQYFRPSSQITPYYAKFQDLFTISDMRPLIDYNQHKTVYSAQIPIIFTNSKESLLLKLLKKSSKTNSIGEKSESEPKEKQKRPEQLNANKYIEYQEKQIVIQKLAIVFVARKEKENKNFMQRRKVLATWTTGNDTQ